MKHAAKLRTREIEYPESDGKPMAESDLHRDWMVCTIHRLKRRYKGRRVYVSGNLLIYFVKGDPASSVAPDAFVVKNCSPRRRRTFKVWEERRVPCWVMETTSKKTRRQDKGPKKETYAELEVGEYFLHDPEGEWVDPPLQGFRLVDGAYKRIPPEPDGGVISKELGIKFILEDGELAMYDARTGERVLSNEELTEQAEQQLSQAERDKAEAERHKAEAERRLAEETAARRQLEEELARLRAPPKNGGPGNGK